MGNGIGEEMYEYVDIIQAKLSKDITEKQKLILQLGEERTTR